MLYNHDSSVCFVIQDTISRIDNVRDPDDVTSVILRLEYLNRAIIIVNSGEYPNSVVLSIGQVLGILKDVIGHNQHTAAKLLLHSFFQDEQFVQNLFERFMLLACFLLIATKVKAILFR